MYDNKNRNLIGHMLHIAQYTPNIIRAERIILYQFHVSEKEFIFITAVVVVTIVQLTKQCDFTITRYGK